ncbi:MAG: amidophosphoribosyltransferase [Opitutae bacterium]|nr:amidophosphoribosyltransferase [Opitutae bacterium]
MSDEIGHHCGIALIRLRKPLAHFSEKYGSPLWGFNQLFLLMEKQHNRGQDGAGIGSMKLNVPPGEAFLFRERSTSTNALSEIFREQLASYQESLDSGEIFPEFPDTVKKFFEHGGEILLGHLRYGTYGSYGSTSCHPYFRKSNWAGKNLMLAANFNLTNVAELNQRLVGLGQHPIFETDTQAILEETCYHLDAANDALMTRGEEEGLAGSELSDFVGANLDLPVILRNAAARWDGGYAIAGIIGNGDCFVMRDPHGIRPAFFVRDDEMVSFASERAPLMTVFGKKANEVEEVEPGTVVLVRADGEILIERIAEDPGQQASCSFERIYFSRGNDPDIYAERKKLGGAMAPQILETVGTDFSKSVFSYVPNTAESAYYGLMDELRLIRRAEVKERLGAAADKGEVSSELIDELVMDNWPRGEKIANKDIKLRTFISQEAGRAQLVSHVYDITYGVVREREDALVVIDDSIVRGTTLKQSIIKILSRSFPRKLVIASTAPQIRYPDCYGIDMSELGKFVAFQAAVELLRERDSLVLLDEVYDDCKKALAKERSGETNHVKRIYTSFSEEEVSAKIADLVRPEDLDQNIEVGIIYQTIENLRKVLPGHTGDWYFTGDYPTPGGYGVAHKAFINYYENKDGRSY